MATPETTRTARVEARIAPEALAVVRRAAELQGRTADDGKRVWRDSSLDSGSAGGFGRGHG